MSIPELKPFCKEAEVAIAGGGFVLRLTMDFTVIDELEGILNRPMDALISELFASVSMQGKFLWRMARRHHRELTLDQAAGVLLSEDGPAVMAALGGLIKSTFHIGEDQEGEQGRPPPKRSRGASRASAGSGSRRGSTRKASGRKPRAAS